MSGGGATWNENHLVPITRNGVRENVYWTYSYSPIDDEDSENGIGRVLVVCSETTTQVRNSQQIAAQSERQRLLLKQMPGFVAVLAESDHRFEFVNDAYVAISGPRNFLGRRVRDVFPELEGINATLNERIADALSERAAIARKSTEVSRAQRAETVLVVDDEPTVRMLVTDLLDDLGYSWAMPKRRLESRPSAARHADSHEAFFHGHFGLAHCGTAAHRTGIKHRTEEAALACMNESSVPDLFPIYRIWWIPTGSTLPEVPDSPSQEYIGDPRPPRRHRVVSVPLETRRFVQHQLLPRVKLV